MNSSTIKKCIITGFKVLTFIASGVSAYFGIKDLSREFSKNRKELPTDDNIVEEHSSFQLPGDDQKKSDVIVGDSGLSQRGQNILGVLGIISSVCLGIFEVVKSLGVVTDSVDKLFHRKRYSLGSRGYIPGNYPWNTPEHGGYPNNAPIYRGQDGKQDGIYWIQREEGITEVW